jgi:predicted  nucleic acid-binding Zn-ribbon protein
MFKWIDDFLKPYYITPTDKSIFDKIVVLEEKYNALLFDIKRLEEENIELTNCLYEVENRLQAKIDNIHPVTYNLKNYALDK